jgi:dienelactone hydrolase
VRGLGKSGGKYAGAQRDDYVSDAEAAIAYLKSRSEVDPHKIGLLSHADGGLVAPLVASATSGLRNLPAMQAALAASANKNVEVEELPDLNLLFQTAHVGIGREANWIEETISPVVLRRIGDWLVHQSVSR